MPAAKVTATPEPTLSFGRRYRRILLVVVLAGAVLQLLLGSYFASIVHSPTPHNLPVGIVAPQSQIATVVYGLQAKNYYKVIPYASTASLTAAIKERKVYGGFVSTSQPLTVYIASGAGSLPAGVLKVTATNLQQSQSESAIKKLQASPTTLPLKNVLAATAPVKVVDVVPLPVNDSNGGSIASLIQVVALGGSIASLGLGRLIPQVRRSFRRGFGHVSTLLIYAAASGGILLLVGSIFGIAANADHVRLFFDYSLISLAITASTAGLVALIGAAGSLTGILYFLIGSTISGASLIPQFLNSFWRVLGEGLPTGSGVYLLRSSYYFPQASNTAAYLTLGLYAVIGVLIVLVTNTLPSRTNQSSEFAVNFIGKLTGDYVEQSKDDRAN